MVHHVAEGDQLYSNQLLHRLTLVAKLLTLALPELTVVLFSSIFVTLIFLF